MPLYSAVCPLPINRKIFRHRASAPPIPQTDLALWLKADAGITTTPQTFISQVVISGGGRSAMNGTYTRASGGDTSFVKTGNPDFTIQWSGAEWYIDGDTYYCASDDSNQTEYAYNPSYDMSSNWLISVEYGCDGTPPTGSTTLSPTGNTLVTAWADQSGNGRNGTADAGYPTLVSSAINGKPAIGFNGTDARITGSEPTTSLPATVIIVAKPLGVEEIGMMYEQFGDGDNTAFYRLAGEPLRIYNGVDLTGVTSIPSNFQIFGAVINGAYSEIYINGSLDVSGDSGDFTPSGNYYLANWVSGDTYTNVQIAEIIVYNKVLTTQERQQVEAYLNTKYAIY